jgi:hypothetical protein
MSGTPKLWLGDATRDKSPSNATSGKARTEFVPMNLRINGHAPSTAIQGADGAALHSLPQAGSST